MPLSSVLVYLPGSGIVSVPVSSSNTNPVVSAWILEFNFWNDSGKWVDSAIWL